MPNLVIKAKTAHIDITGTSFMVYGKRYHEAARVWMATSESDGKFDPVSYQLLCQSLELHLKSFIWLADGIGHEQLRNRYGHDLVKLWREAKAKGVSRYARVTPARERTIDLLGPYYKDRKFCYLDIDMVFRGFRDLDEGPHALETLVRLTKQLGVALREPILRRANAAQ